MPSLYRTPDDSQTIDPVLDALGGGRVVAYKVLLAHAIGGVTAGLLASQMWFWANTPSVRHDGDWFAITQDEITDQTALTRHESDAARRRLRELGILEEQRKGVPARIWYRLNKERLVEVIRGYLAQKATPDESAIQIAEIRQTEDDGDNSANQLAEKQQSSLPNFGNQERQDASSQSDGNRQSHIRTHASEITERSIKITTADQGAPDNAAPLVEASPVVAVSSKIDPHDPNLDLIQQVANITGCFGSASSILGEFGIEVVSRQLALWSTRKPKSNPGGMFRTACKQDWAALGEAEKERRDEQSKVRAADVTARRAFSAPAPVQPRITDEEKARLDAIAASLSPCARDRLENEIDEHIKSTKPVIARRLEAFRAGTKVAGRVVEAEITATRYMILAERSAALA